MRYVAFATTRIIGILFILLGILGLFLPILQGFLFLAIGLYFYSFSSPRLRLWLDTKIAPYPKLAYACSRIDGGIRRVFRLD
jgi:uncharacterized protein